MTDNKITNLMTTLDVTRKGAERIADIVRAGYQLLVAGLWAIVVVAVLFGGLMALFA